MKQLPQITNKGPPNMAALYVDLFVDLFVEITPLTQLPSRRSRAHSCDWPEYAHIPPWSQR